MRIASAGAGIGGLTLAPTLQEVGVGVNLQPDAIEELVALGLLLALDRTGSRILSGYTQSV